MKIEVAKTTILKHREQLAFLDRKYPATGPTQSDLDPPVDMTQELQEEQPQAAPQAAPKAVVMDTDTPEAALVEPPQGGELVQAT